MFTGCPLFRHSDFVSAQYLENELMEFDQILHNALILTRARLELLGVNFRQFSSYGP